MPDEIRHPLFARFFDRFSRGLEGDLGPLRDKLTQGLHGRVLELGAGNGINFSHYPPEVEEVVAIEPEPYLRSKALEATTRAPVPVTVRAGAAGSLSDAGAGSFDAAVCSLVLCSVPDQPGALEELRVLLRPAGELRFLEHVRGDGSLKSAVQRAADASGIWSAMFGGCHCSRATLAAVEAAGFEISEVRPVNLGPGWLVTNPHLIGKATATGRGGVAASGLGEPS